MKSLFSICFRKIIKNTLVIVKLLNNLLLTLFSEVNSLISNYQCFIENSKNRFWSTTFFHPPTHSPYRNSTIPAIDKTNFQCRATFFYGWKAVFQVQVQFFPLRNSFFFSPVWNCDFLWPSENFSRDKSLKFVLYFVEKGSKRWWNLKKCSFLSLSSGRGSSNNKLFTLIMENFVFKSARRLQESFWVEADRSEARSPDYGANKLKR